MVTSFSRPSNLRFLTSIHETVFATGEESWRVFGWLLLSPSLRFLTPGPLMAAFEASCRIRRARRFRVRPWKRAHRVCGGRFPAVTYGPVSGSGFDDTTFGGDA